MSFAMSGIASGMDTASLVNQLMSLEAIPQRQLQTKSAEMGNKITAYQGLNSRLSSVIEASKKISGDDALAATKATSSDESVKVTSSKTSDVASLAMRVDRLATKQTNVLTNEDLAKLPVPPNMSITVGTEIHTLSPASGSMEDVAKAINSAEELGLKAVMVRAGVGDQYVLQITGKPGAENTFSISATAADGTETVLADSANATVKAQDAQITLTDLGKTVTSASNTFEGLMPGVDVTVSKVTTDPVTIGVEKDTEGPAKSAKALVDTLNVVFNEIDSRTKATQATVEGRQIMKAGVLGGDAVVRGLQNALQTAGSYPIDGKSPSSLGITVGRDGKFSFDEEKFAEALKNDPAGTNEFMTKLSARVQKAAESYGDPRDGLLSQRIKSEESNRRSIDDQALKWDARLDARRSTLERQFAALESVMQSMQGQQQWLASQLAGLPKWG